MRTLQEGKITLTMRTPPPKPPTLQELIGSIDLNDYIKPTPPSPEAIKAEQAEHLKRFYA